MNQQSSQVDREARIKATSFAFRPGAARGGHAETRSQSPAPVPPVEDTAERDVWWWAGRIIAWTVLVAAVVAPWGLLLAERLSHILNGEF